jgi:hypothetical protein
MGAIADMTKRMHEAGVPMDAILMAIEAFEAQVPTIEQSVAARYEAQLDERRAKDRERARRYRERHAQSRDETLQDVNECDVTLEKKIPHTPLRKTTSPQSPKGDSPPKGPDHFEEFRRVYPRRDGPNPWKPAEVSFSRAVRKGADPLAIIAAARTLREQHPSPTPFVPQAATWLNQERWRDMEPTGPPPGLGPSVEEILAGARRAAG